MYAVWERICYVYRTKKVDVRSLLSQDMCETMCPLPRPVRALSTSSSLRG